MADARICDCCRKVFGSNEKIVEPKYRLLINDPSLEERRSMGMGTYKEPELCPECVNEFIELILKSRFGKIC